MISQSSKSPNTPVPKSLLLLSLVTVTTGKKPYYTGLNGSLTAQGTGCTRNPSAQWRQLTPLPSRTSFTRELPASRDDNPIMNKAAAVQHHPLGGRQAPCRHPGPAPRELRTRGRWERCRAVTAPPTSLPSSTEV